MAYPTLWFLLFGIILCGALRSATAIQPGTLLSCDGTETISVKSLKGVYPSLIPGNLPTNVDALLSDAACPRSLDCTLRRRALCPPGSGACGPCLRPFVEDDLGRCIPKKQLPRGKMQPWPNLEEEIDLLANMLAHQDTVPHRQDTVPQRFRWPAATLVSPGQEPDTPSPQGAQVPTITASHSSSRPVEMSPVDPPHPSNDVLVLMMIVVCAVAGLSALIVAVICWCRLQKEIRLAQKTDYSSKSQKVSGSPAFGRSMPGDKKLAQSAQMYHYQHQKQQMLSLEKHKEQPKIMDSGSSEEENEDGDFTVYECPGLAPMNALTGEMEVKNPMFDDSALVGPSPRATAGSRSGSGPRVSSGSRTAGSRTGPRPSPGRPRLVAPKSHQ
ncbi:neural proliferation differentiation and control protein 1 isoform X2 [Phascolarctos cinereus]|uniref:Neural proliferation differentiation and control protein 1 isoform X2 n=1 Tax=Phascolarctos cinereus TaxID=38626 RepID=A0A6P5JYG8_PHACI|nr:neural proliferation differentiation and control protein 1 isoform X2 [Phascolarctos cinereus]